MNPNRLERLSLLVVEDSPADVFLVQEAMKEEGLGCHLEVADNGEAAIRILDRIDAGSASVPNLLLLDVNVPRYNGTEVLKRLRQSHRCRTTAVVMMSTSDTQVERQRALDLGANAYFCKPSSLAEFMQLGKLVRGLLEASTEGLPEPNPIG
jgi:chemotaxis family two-component system response regulator Rcp1